MAGRVASPGINHATIELRKSIISPYVLFKCVLSCGCRRGDGWLVKYWKWELVEGWYFSYQWRNNERDGVSNRQPHHCLLKRLFRRRWKKTSKLRAIGLCAGNSPVTGEFPAQMARKRFHSMTSSCWWIFCSCLIIMCWTYLSPHVRLLSWKYWGLKNVYHWSHNMFYYIVLKKQHTVYLDENSMAICPYVRVDDNKILLVQAMDYLRNNVKVLHQNRF